MRRCPFHPVGCRATLHDAFGADAKQKNNAGDTALKWAESRDALEIVKMLKEARSRE
jgi:ankyrin repeat protein